MSADGTPTREAMYTFEAGGRRWATVKEAFDNARGGPVYVTCNETGTRCRVVRP